MAKAEKFTMTEKWLARMKKAKVKFALVRTRKAIYSRVAIVKELARAIIVQYPYGKPQRNSVLTRISSIKQERIEREDIERIRYYTN